MPDSPSEKWTRRERLHHWLTGRVPTRIYLQRMMQLERDRLRRDQFRAGLIEWARTDASAAVDWENRP